MIVYRKSKAGQQYSLILNRNRSDTLCAEDDDYLTVEDYDIHDGDSNIVINHGMSLKVKDQIIIL